MNNLSKISSIIFRQIELAMPNFLMKLKLRTNNYSDAGRWKTLGGGGAVVKGGDNLSSPVQIGLTDLQNIGGGGAGPPLPPPVPPPLKLKPDENGKPHRN